MKSTRVLLLGTAIAAAISPFAAAHYGYRQYYSPNWVYSTTYQYYYVTYYYQPVVTQTSYNYHYCVYYPAQPRYIYYYNPVSQVYWGRYEIGSKGDKRYSILAEKDRKKDLKDIGEDAFPAPSKMPTIPGASDDVAIEPPPENVPKDKG